MNAHGVSIVRAGLLELPALAALFDAYRQFYGQAADLARAEAFLRARMVADESVVFLARGADSTDLGFTQLFASFSSVSTAPIWILNDLYVAPAARGRGVGRALLERARVHAVETGAARIELSTAHTNTTAQRLYEASGYVLDTEFRKYLLATAP